MWIDSPRNNPASGPEYEFFEGNDKTKPRLNGDRPWVHRRNNIYARIRNTGPQSVSDVYATCYVNSPPGIGDNGQWATLATKHIPSIDGHNERTVDFEWAPSESKHTCLKVAIMPKIGEIETENNMAQENVGVFDSAAASSHQPIVLEAEVRSPFVIWRKVDLIVRGLPLGWHAEVDKSWLWLEGHGSAPIKYIYLQWIFIFPIKSLLSYLFRQEFVTLRYFFLLYLILLEMDIFEPKEEEYLDPSDITVKSRITPNFTS